MSQNERDQIIVLNQELSEEWEPFSGTGDGENFQSYLKAGGFGVIGRPGHWQIVHAEDGQPAVSIRPASLQQALTGAEALFVRYCTPEGRQAAGETDA